MQLDIYQVDAFSRGPFTGNPAAVVPLKDWLPDNLMQKIAEENNLAETAFFTNSDEGYYIRWFTPAVEVALCGHATLATAYIIFNILGHSSNRINFNCKSGPISVTQADDLLTLDFPTDKLVQCNNVPDHLIEGLGAKPIELWQGRDDLLCIFESEDSVLNLHPNFGILQKMSGRGVITTAASSGEFDFISRGFFPQSGINEDPATGSAHTTLTPYWSKSLGKKSLNACQMSSRKGFFQCVDNGDRTLISGRSDLYLTGQIFI